MCVDAAVSSVAGGEQAHDPGATTKLPNPRLEGYLGSLSRSDDGRAHVLLTNDETYEGTDFP